MKRIAVYILTLVCLFIFAGCTKQTDTLTVYSFSGGNEHFTITNGVIILNDKEEIIYGGNFVEKNERFSDVTAFSHSLYVDAGNDRIYLLENKVIDETGGTIKISDSVGQRSGDIVAITEEVDWENNLYFELKTTDLDGEEKGYQLKMDLVEIVGATTK